MTRQYRWVTCEDSQGLLYLDGCIYTESQSNYIKLIKGIKGHDLVIYHDLCYPTIQIINCSGQFQAAVAANVLAPPSLSLQQVVELQDHWGLTRVTLG